MQLGKKLLRPIIYLLPLLQLASFHMIQREYYQLYGVLVHFLNPLQLSNRQKHRLRLVQYVGHITLIKMTLQRSDWNKSCELMKG